MIERYYSAQKSARRSNDRPMVAGECIAWIYDYSKQFDQLKKTYPEVDKKAYIEATKHVRGSTPYSLPAKYLKFGGIRTYVNADNAHQFEAAGYKKMIELLRQDNHLLAGFNTHVARTVSGATDWQPRPAYYAIRQACSPVLICLGIFDKNLFGGGSLTAKMFLINDTPEKIGNVDIVLKLVDDGGKEVSARNFKADSIAGGGKQIISCNLPVPATAKTGIYKVVIEARENTQELSANEYEIFVLGTDKRVSGLVQKEKVALYIKDRPSKLSGTDLDPSYTKRIFDQLKIKYDRIRNFKGLSGYSVVVIGANSLDDIVKQEGEVIRNWIERGGKLLCFEQYGNSVIPWLSEAKIEAGDSIFTDLIVNDHPIFKDLTQKNFSEWNDGGTVFTSCITPLSECLIATGVIRGGFRPVEAFGMTVAEVRQGKGISLFSQLLASGRYNRDSSATKYILNVLEYCLGGNWSRQYAEPFFPHNCR